jgi:PadR family transcriptional regulator
MFNIVGDRTKEEPTLGEFEMFVLAALEHLGDDAYGASIQAEIESRSQRPTPFGSVYVTLERLAKKGYVTFWVGEPRPVQGGRSRKHVRITPAGRRALHESARALDRMFAGLRLNPDAGRR